MSAKQVRYERALADSRRAHESEDCTVIATALAARMPYAEAHAMLAALGRKNRKGFKTWRIAEELGHRGYRVTATWLPKQKNGSLYTPKTIGKLCKRGYWMVQVRRHVFAVINGEVYDWVRGRRHHVIRVYRIERKRA